jgi:hypothetical protein
LLQVAVDRRPHGVEMGAHGAQLVDTLLLELAELISPLGVALVGMAQLFLQP